MKALNFALFDTDLFDATFERFFFFGERAGSEVVVVALFLKPLLGFDETIFIGTQVSLLFSKSCVLTFDGFLLGLHGPLFATNRRCGFCELQALGMHSASLLVE